MPYWVAIVNINIAHLRYFDFGRIFVTGLQRCNFGYYESIAPKSFARGSLARRFLARRTLVRLGRKLAQIVISSEKLNYKEPK